MRRILLLSLVLMFAEITGADTVTFRNRDESFKLEFVAIDAPGNQPDDPDSKGAWGAVDYVYQIAKYELSESQFGVFADTNRFLAPEFSDLPAGKDWVRMAGFVNWLNTTSGFHPAYKMLPLGDEHGTNAMQNLPWQQSDEGFDPDNPLRNSLARYVIPTADEWHKAAYYDPETGEYFDYANGSNESPTSVATPTLAQDEVIHSVVGDAAVDVTMAGGLSPFGTMGQTGNGYEWEEGFFQEGFHAQRTGGQVSAADLAADRSRQFPFAPAGLRVVRLQPDSDLLGDFDGDGLISVSDIDMLSEQVRTASGDLSFDINSDGVLDSLDRTEWVEQLANTSFGDSNLSGEVAFNDFLAIANNFDQPAGWAGGDFDGNGMADFQDFLLLANNFGASNAEGVAAVPEPSSLVLCSGLLGLLRLRRRRR